MQYAGYMNFIVSSIIDELNFIFFLLISDVCIVRNVTTLPRFLSSKKKVFLDIHSSVKMNSIFERYNSCMRIW